MHIFVQLVLYSLRYCVPDWSSWCLAGVEEFWGLLTTCDAISRHSAYNEDSDSPAVGKVPNQTTRKPAIARVSALIYVLPAIVVREMWIC